MSTNDTKLHEIEINLVQHGSGYFVKLDGKEIGGIRRVIIRDHYQDALPEIDITILAKKIFGKVITKNPRIIEEDPTIQ